MRKTCNRFSETVLLKLFVFFFLPLHLAGNFSLCYKSHSRYLRFRSALLADGLT